MTTPDTSSHDRETDGSSNETKVPTPRVGDQPVVQIGRGATAAALDALRVDRSSLDDYARAELERALSEQLTGLGYEDAAHPSEDSVS